MVKAIDCNSIIACSSQVGCFKLFLKKLKNNDIIYIEIEKDKNSFLADKVIKPPRGYRWVALILSQTTDEMTENSFNGVRYTCDMGSGILL